MVITKIERQKKNPSRISLYIDNEFAIGIHKEVLLKFGFRVGDHLAEKTLREVQESEELYHARESALRLLAYRARSKKEIRDRLKKKKFSEETIKKVLSSLGRSGLINDLEFGRAFAHDKLMRKPMGKGMLKMELRKKGLGKEDVERILSEVYSDEAEGNYALELAIKRLNRFHATYERLDPMKKKKRLADYLARRGFDWETVARTVERVLPEPQ